MGSDYHKRERERGESLLVFIDACRKAFLCSSEKEQNGSMIGDLKEISKTSCHSNIYNFNLYPEQIYTYKTKMFFGIRNCEIKK